MEDTPAPAVLERLEHNERQAIDRLIDWLAIPSISTDPAYDTHTRDAAQWARDRLAEAGFDARLVETAPEGGRGHPMVLATTEGEPGSDAPHVLFYGHYDVQPPDPLELWETGPFEPALKPAEGELPERVVARGAADDKGQVAMFLEAVRAWHDATGKPGGGVRFTVMLEGEEESGSLNLPAFVERHADRLDACDICVISDTGMLARGKPAITYGVRGMAYTEIVLHGPDQDLHSGLWGGRAPNPINELVRVLAQLHDADRRVTIPGFYDGVAEPDPEEIDRWRALGIDPAEQLASIGFGPEADVGEKGHDAIARNWARPTCDINGIVGGYTGEGAKTVIPAHASAKVSFRLVDEQDPEGIRDAFFAWLDERTPPGCRWEKIDHHGGAPVTLPIDSPELRAASRAIERACGAKPALIRSGGSIPVAGLLKQRLGLDTIFMGFGLDDDRVHSPNEKFELDCYRMGARSHALLIDELRTMARG